MWVIQPYIKSENPPRSSKWVLQFLSNGTNVPAYGYHTCFKVLHFFLEKFYKPTNLHRSATA